MSKYLNAIKITDSVYWVGAIDWNVRNFHGYTTSKGTTYNAFLILADKITLIDTVKHGFANELISRISSIIAPEKIDYIISNHAEPDHSGSMPEIVRVVKPEKIFASKMGVKALEAHYGCLEGKIEAVEDNSELSLGNKTLKFMETRMLHWPDSMFSYLVEEKVLFSQDAFGMHLASSKRFDTSISWDILKQEAESYYANIITLYSPHVVKLIEKLNNSGLELDIVCPDHGPVWTSKENFGKIVSLYKKWATRKVDKKAVIIYDTMWHSTETMARYIEDSLTNQGIAVKSMSMSSSSRSEVADEMLDACAVVIGSPTLNNNLLPSIADVLTYIKGLKFKTPVCASFGSFGWSGESIKQIDKYFEEMGSEVVGSVKAKYIPTEDVKKACYELGKQVAEKIFDNINND